MNRVWQALRRRRILPVRTPARGPARTADQRFRSVQLVLFVSGAVLMPLGLVAILLGWYGTAHARYAYDQTTYLVSGGVLGVGLILLGGFLYFGAWLARIAHDQQETSRRLAETLIALAGRDGAVPERPTGHPSPGHGAPAVLAGTGSTLHRRDCALVAHREDLHVPAEGIRGLAECRVCRPAPA